ncbi:MAG: hypothetical protein JWO82_4266 [Akkermansiaceae bacterium]|nr:hypothetical protein [Akkermansiaceae bacterium]
MKTTRVSCQGCGASLEVHDLARYSTCAYCATQLEVVHETGAMQAQALDILERHNRRLSAELSEYRLREELSLLDKAWKALRQSWLEPDGRGGYYDPALTTAVFSCLLILGGIVLFALTIQSMAPIAIAGPLMVLGGIWGLIRCAYKGMEHEAMTRQYDHRRSELLERLRQAEAICRA